MRILLINPAKSKQALDRDLFDYRFASRFVGKRNGTCGLPLAVPTVAAITPPGVDVRIVDDNVEEVPFDDGADLVGITATTLQASRAYAIADHLRAAGRLVVLGGVHPSFMPEDAARHADCVVVGEAEEVWPRVVEDFGRGVMRPLYRAPRKAPLTLSPPPARHLQRNRAYLVDMLQTTRGCPFDCEFCSVQDFLGSRMRCKTPAQVRRELEDIFLHSVEDNHIRQLMITDDNLVGSRAHARRILDEVLIPFNEAHDITGWTCQASVTVASKEENLERLRRAGARKLFIGFESVDPRVLRGMNKRVSRADEYAAVVEKVRRHGMDVMGSFILGSDEDTPDCFEATARFIEATAITTNLVNILVPFPGTRLFARLEREGRLLDRDWSHYDMKHCVFLPRHMTPEELEQGWVWVNQQIYRPDRMADRIMHSTWSPAHDRDPLKHRIFVMLRLAHHLPVVDTPTRGFILRCMRAIADARSNLSVTRVVHALDHIDFARSLTGYEGRDPIPPGEELLLELAAAISSEVRT